MPTGKSKALLTDIGTEELTHLEVIAAMVYQLTKDASLKELEAAGLGGHYADHHRAYSFPMPRVTPGLPPIFKLKEIRSLICTRI